MIHLGAFLLTPSYELSMERASMIFEKMNFKGCFSLTKTATGILFKFSHPDDYQIVFKKGFHKVTGARFYRKESYCFNTNLKEMNWQSVFVIIIFHIFFHTDCYSLSAP